MVAPALMGLAWSSAAALAMAPLQDLLNLGSEARMNMPGLPAGNWRWRCTEEMLSASAFQWLQDLTESSSRAGGQEKKNRRRGDGSLLNPLGRRSKVSREVVVRSHGVDRFQELPPCKAS